MQEAKSTESKISDEGQRKIKKRAGLAETIKNSYTEKQKEMTGERI